MSWASPRGKNTINTKNRAVLSTRRFHPTFRAAPGTSVGCIRQNLVPRPKAPQGSWVASRGCCGALAARQPMHPRPGGGLAPTPAASRSTLRTRTRGAQRRSLAPKRGPLLVQLLPRALSRNQPKHAAPAGAPKEAGAEPATASAAGPCHQLGLRSYLRHGDCRLRTGQPPQRTRGGGARGRGGVSV